MRLRWRPEPVTLPPIIVYGPEVRDAQREEDAQLAEAACDWKAGMYAGGASHDQFHFGYRCPYEVVAALLRGEPDPRRP